MMNQPEDPARDVLADALKLEEGPAREAFIDQACNGDPVLRKYVTELLQAQAAADQLLKQQPAASGPQSLKFVGLQTTAPRPGDRIGRYRLLQQIGEGGCGVVFMAGQEEPIRRKVALKVIKLGMDTVSVVARFEAERQALGLMDHPNIAQVFDGGATETGRPYFVMELVRGLKITDYCDQGALGTRERLDLFIQVCHAVQHAHQKGIIHRDLKPSNILVTLNDGMAVPKVIDFGIAKAMEGRLTDKTLFTSFELLLGTPAYMSPEQAVLTSLDVDTRGDIYSLGVLLYELLTGTTPFDGRALLAAGLDEFRRTIREQEPLAPSNRLRTLVPETLTTTASRRGMESPKLIQSLRGDLDWIVMKCLEKNRTRRYQTANALAMDLTRFLRNEPVLARPPSKLDRLGKMVRRNKVLFASGGAVAAALIVGLVVSLLLLFQEKAARRAAVNAELKAVTETRKAGQTVRLLRETLSKAATSVKGLDARPLTEFLDQTVTETAADLRNDPELEQDLWNTVALLYLDFGEKQKAEQTVRKALALPIKRAGHANAVPVDALIVLGDVLLENHKFVEAERFFDNYPLKPEGAKVESPQILSVRAAVRARLGRWPDAIADYGRLIELTPQETENYLFLAPLLVTRGDYAAYRQLRERIVNRFGGGGGDSSMANRMATVCLLLPANGTELAVATRRADQAITLGKGRSNEEWCQFCKGLAEYRNGHPAGAVDRMRKVLAGQEENPRLWAESYMVLAMAQRQLGQNNDARAAFAKGAEIIQANMPALEGVDLTGAWNDWLVAHALRREAESLIQ